MKGCNVRKELIDDIYSLVSHHETGGNKRADVLRDADSISFFHVNLPYYFVRNGIKETKRRCLWGYRKLPRNLQEVMVKFNYKNKELESLVRAWIKGR